MKRESPGLNADQVETHRTVAMARMIPQEHAGGSRKAFTLMRAQRVQGIVKTGTRLDLDKNEKVPAAQNKIDLPNGGPIALGQQPEAQEPVAPKCDPLRPSSTGLSTLP